MKTLRFFVFAAACLAMTGCAALQGSTTGADAIKASQVTLTAYADVYQPAVIVYGHLPACPGATLCKDAAVLAKLKAADATATATIVAAQAVLEGSATDTGQLAVAVQAIQAAEVAIAASGALKQ